MTQEIIDEKKIQENLFNLGIVNSPLIKQTKDELESIPISPSEPEMPAYGALPYFDDRKKIVASLPEKLSYFNYNLVPEDKRDLARASEGILLFETKAGFPPSQLSEQILANYPDLNKEGKVISIFGLSGSGKSLALEAIREKYGDEVVVIDNDTSRYNLLAKIVSDAEKSVGKSAEQIKSSKVIHNRISGPFYMVLDHVTAELRNRGYLVVRASTEPYVKADHGFYIEHPDGIDPTSLLASGEEAVKSAAQQLHQRTSQRVDGKDNYEWENPKLITQFEDMQEVTVQVPVSVHERFIRNVGEKLSKSTFTILYNPEAETIDQAKRTILEQLNNTL